MIMALDPNLSEDELISLAKEHPEKWGEIYQHPNLTKKVSVAISQFHSQRMGSPITGERWGGDMTEEERAQAEADTIERLIAEREAARAQAIEAGENPEAATSASATQPLEEASMEIGKTKPRWALWRK